MISHVASLTDVHAHRVSIAQNTPQYALRHNLKLSFVNTHATYLYENVANLECKMIRHMIVEFCGKFFIPVEDGWAIVPNPFKAILKLGRRDMTNWYHVEAYRVSASDNLAALAHGHLGDDLARALHERYDLEWVNAEVLVSGLLGVVESMATFSRLFYAGPTARICQDRSLPNIDI